MQTHKIDGKMLDWLLFCEKVLYNNIQDGVIVLLGIGILSAPVGKLLYCAGGFELRNLGFILRKLNA